MVVGLLVRYAGHWFSAWPLQPVEKVSNLRHPAVSN